MVRVTAAIGSRSVVPIPSELLEWLPRGPSSRGQGSLALPLPDVGLPLLLLARCVPDEPAPLLPGCCKPTEALPAGGAPGSDTEAGAGSCLDS